MPDAVRTNGFGSAVPVIASWVLGVLCVVTLAAWGRSVLRTDWVVVIRADPTHSANISVGSARGRLQFSYTSKLQDPVMLARSHIRWERAEPHDLLAPTTFWRRRGFMRHVTFRPHIRRAIVVVPHWFVALPFAAVPAWHAARALRRRRRLARGRCPDCGYDLRGAPGACPECGAASPFGRPGTRTETTGMTAPGP